MVVPTRIIVEDEHVAELRRLHDLDVLEGRVGLVDAPLEVVLDQLVVRRREVAVEGAATPDRRQPAWQRLDDRRDMQQNMTGTRCCKF